MRRGIAPIVSHALVAIVIAATVVVIPFVVVVPAAGAALPVTGVILSSVVTRHYPARAPVRRPRPISRMPLIMISHRIPVAVHPHEFGSRSQRAHAHHARWRRSAY